MRVRRDLPLSIQNFSYGSLERKWALEHIIIIHFRFYLCLEIRIGAAAKFKKKCIIHLAPSLAYFVNDLQLSLLFMMDSAAGTRNC